MGDAVLRVRGQLQAQARGDWAALEAHGLKAVLFDRLLDALEEEQKEDGAPRCGVQQQEQQQQEQEQQKQEQELDVIIIDSDGDADDEIVRESVGSNKSPRELGTSQAAASQAVQAPEDDVAAVDEEQRTSSPMEKDGKGGGARDDDELALPAENAARETPRTELDAAASVTEADSAVETPDIAGTSHDARHAVEGAASAAEEELVPRDDRKLARKSMQVSGKSELLSPLAWKRKSILRKASSLASSTRGTRKVSFAPTDMIVESSQTESTQPDASPEKPPQTPQDDRNSRSESIHTPSDISTSRLDPTPKTPRVDGESTRTESIAGSDSRLTPFSTPAASSSPSTSPQDPLTSTNLESETEEHRRKREFDEHVAREAQKLRAASMLSAQKRLEEAKASKAFWAKRDQLKAKLRASSAGDKMAPVRTPVLSSSGSHAAGHISPRTSESSATTRERGSTPSATSRPTTSTSKDAPQVMTPNLDEEEAKDYDFMRSMARHHEVESISDVSSALDSTLNDPRAPRSTYYVVEEQLQVERSLHHRLADKSAAKSTPESAGVTNESVDKPIVRDNSAKKPVHEPSLLTSKSLHEEATKSLDLPKTQDIEAPANRNRSDSLSSTVSSIPEPSVVENALKSGTSSGTTGTRRPIPNLISGLHSFTTLLEKHPSSQESKSGRSAPVVNALKLAERSRVVEEQKRLEKEKRKALLKKKMEEHKKAAALKEKAEKEAQAKREQELMNERKKREAELARKRQQKVKEMRAGLEKKRAMLAAEKKAGLAASATTTSKAATVASSQQKPRGLASTTGLSQSAAKQASRPLVNPVSKVLSKPLPKPASKPAPTSKIVSQLASKPVPKPAMMSPQPVKHAPKSHSPEIVNYEMSDNVESSDGESSDSDSERHGKKKVPKWAQKDHLNKILQAQFGKNAVDPSPGIFQDFVDTCNLEAIFETTDIRKKKRFARRTSSGNWLADRPTAHDRALYQRDMGYDR
ncbi:unnamed protein product [Phytophthora fragariaefolia]|uniref:Unnamed protein product n=1 Tax=Phytophthora fragariaefolia TaxID=1490495 RepID=A0A9W6UCC9_9STRA|nr:unnamed protein product [Phytophthora fragariaefolia]